MTRTGLIGTALAAVLVTASTGPLLAEGAVVASPAAPAAGEAPAATAAPVTDDAFVARVRKAVADHDIDFFENHLIDWDGVRKRTQRLTLYQVRECFGRPVKSVAMEPLKLDPGTPLLPDGYKTNRPVTHLLRIAFDEAHGPGESPACVLMLSKDPVTSYRMVVVLPTAPPPK